MGSMEYSAGIILIVQVIYKLRNMLVQCNVQLPLVTAITFTNIVVFSLGMDLCLSNSHMIFLLIPHFRSLNITIDFRIVFPSDSSSKFFNKCLTISVLPSLPFPSLHILYLIPLSQSAVNTLSP